MRQWLVPLINALALAAAFTGCAPAPSPAGDLQVPVPEFTLTERGGKTVSRDDLKGKVWIASFVYTSCCTECPRMMGVLARLQNELADQKDVRLVSFTVDPDRDSPEVLRQYAARYHADAERWLFLTGEQTTVYPLVEKGFLLAVAQRQGAERKPGAEVLHSQKLAVVDRQGRIRGYFNALDEGDLAKLKQTVAALAKERP